MYAIALIFASNNKFTLLWLAFVHRLSILLTWSGESAVLWGASVPLTREPEDDGVSSKSRDDELLPPLESLVLDLAVSPTAANIVENVPRNAKTVNEGQNFLLGD